jgi:hypothetical protein
MFGPLNYVPALEETEETMRQLWTITPQFITWVMAYLFHLGADCLVALVLFQGIFILGDPSFCTMTEKVWHLLLGSCVIIEEILSIYPPTLKRKERVIDKRLVVLPLPYFTFYSISCQIVEFIGNFVFVPPIVSPVIESISLTGLGESS